MKKYYNGDLISPRFLSEKNINLYLGNQDIIIFDNKTYNDRYNLLNPKEQAKIVDYLQEMRKVVILDLPDDVRYILNKIFDDKILSYRYVDERIIYELIVDENDEYYAKEIITGNVFPVVKKNNVKLNYQFNQEKDLLDGFINRGDKKEYLIGNIADDNTFITNNIEYYYGEHPHTSRYYHLKNLRENNEKKAGDYSRYYIKMSIVTFNVIATYSLSFNNLDRCETFVNPKMIANQEEINRYINKYRNTLINRSFRRNFIKNLNKCASENVFKGDIVPKIEETKQLKIDDVTKIMERIELNLLKLKSYNENSYYKLNREYQDALRNQDDHLKIPITKKFLECLEAKILLNLKFDKNNGDNIINYLNYQKEEYLKCFLTNEHITTITLQDIDDLMSLYLKIQNEFDIVSKRNIIRNISLLYLFELYENKDKLDENILDNTYLNECLISIILWINTLLEFNIIKTDYLIDINYHYTIDDLLKIISNMELNITPEKIKLLK